MPLVINRHGIVACVNEDRLHDALTSQGCRLLDQEDWNYADGDAAAAFEVPHIEGIARHWLGNRPVVVSGAGPSHAASVNGSYRIAVNPRPHAEPADAVLALDDCYWQGAVWPAAHSGALKMYPKGGAGPDDTEGAARFTLPIYPVKQRDWRTIAMRCADNIVHAHFSSVAALLVARYMTQGSVILTGVDLEGNDDAGDSYAQRQGWVWEKIAAVTDRVFVHPAMRGPLVDMFPRWSYGYNA